MPQTDVIVLGAGIVGTSAALHLAGRGLTVALVDRKPPGEETSYGNAGIIEGNTYFPYPLPSLKALARIAFRRAPEASYHLGHLPKLFPWLRAYANASTPEAMLGFAHAMRPLFSRAVAEHEALIRDAGVVDVLRTNGWLKLYRSETVYEATRRDLDVILEAGITFQPLDQSGALALEPDIAPIFKRAVFWPTAASISNPLRLTRAYAKRFTDLGGKILTGDARTLKRADFAWNVDTNEGKLSAGTAVLSLGPWAPDVLDPLGIKLPLMVKRGYHKHYRPLGNKGLSRPVLDAEVGYVAVPMEQGIRLTTGAEFAARDAEPTPTQFRFVEPAARALFPIGEAVEDKPWLGSRPCFPDSMPVIGRAPKQQDLWLDFGHAHWGLTLGPVSGRLLADMITGATPFTDPKPYAAERFGKG